MLSFFSSLAFELLQRDGGGFLGTIYGLTASCVSVLFIVAYIAGLWLIFNKAGEAGWKAIIPIYNLWVLLEIVGRPGWFIILFFIPIVQIIAWIFVALDLSKSFDKSGWYALGILLFPWLFLVILGLGEAQYYGPANER